MKYRTPQAAGSGGSLVGDMGHEAVSLQQVVSRYHDSLIRFLRQRLRVPEDANDVAQEAYIRMMKYEGSREIRSPSSMLFRVAVNAANDLGRAMQARHGADHSSLDGIELPSDAPSAERELAAEQDLDRVQRTIEALPPKCRQVFLLSRVRGMTYPQIAEHCGISVKMVEKHISRALAACTREVRVGGGRRQAS